MPNTKKRSRSRRKSRKTDVVLRPIASKGMQHRTVGTVMPATLQYYDFFNLGADASLFAVQTFRLSSLFSPDANLAPSAHQPMGFDQLTPLFERYQVWKVDYKIVMHNTDADFVQQVGYYVSDQETTPSLFGTCVEQALGEWNQVGVQGSGNDRVTFQGSVRLNDIHGVSYTQYMGNDDYGALVSANPIENVYLHVTQSGFGANRDGVTCSIHLQMHAKMMGANVTTAS